MKKIMMTKGFGMGLFGRFPFDKDARKKFQEEWSKMTDSEKLDFMNKRVEEIGKDRFSVESIDALCEEWMKKTPEEKEAFIKEKKEAMESRFGEHFHGRGGLGFGRHPGDCFFGGER